MANEVWNVDNSTGFDSRFTGLWRSIGLARSMAPYSPSLGCANHKGDWEGSAVSERWLFPVFPITSTDSFDSSEQVQLTILSCSALNTRAKMTGDADMFQVGKDHC